MPVLYSGMNDVIGIIFVLVLNSRMVFAVLILSFMSFQEFVDTPDLNTIALVPGRAIILMNLTIEWIELSFIFSNLKGLLLSFLFRSSLLDGYFSLNLT